MATIPDYAEFITEYDEDGYYTIMSGRAYIFRIEPTNPMLLRLQQVGRGNQDFSLKCWFSLKPYDQQMFYSQPLVDIFSLTRQERPILLTDTHFGPAEWTPQPFYVNILNMQNSVNFFKFLFQEPVDNPSCNC